MRGGCCVECQWMSGSEGEQAPPAGQTIELVFVTVHEMELRADHEVNHRPRHQHLSWTGLHLDTLSDMHGDACDVVTPPLEFSRVHPNAHCDAQLAKGIADRDHTLPRG